MVIRFWRTAPMLLMLATNSNAFETTTTENGAIHQCRIDAACDGEQCIRTIGGFGVLWLEQWNDSYFIGNNPKKTDVELGLFATLEQAEQYISSNPTGRYFGMFLVPRSSPSHSHGYSMHGVGTLGDGTKTWIDEVHTILSCGGPRW